MIYLNHNFKPLKTPLKHQKNAKKKRLACRGFAPAPNLGGLQRPLDPSWFSVGGCAP